jgi:hypothetical protein
MQLAPEALFFLIARLDELALQPFLVGDVTGRRADETPRPREHCPPLQASVDAVLAPKAILEADRCGGLGNLAHFGSRSGAVVSQGA